MLQILIKNEIWLFDKIKETFKNIDKKNRISVLLNISLEIFRVILACGLTAFVPQKCFGGEGCQDDLNETEMVCRINTNINIYCVKEFKLFVLTFNIFTSIAFLSMYFIEIKRDQWLMKHFERDEEQNDKNLESYHLQYEELFRKLDNYNAIYYICYKITAFIYITNTILSCILFYFYYYNSTTITTLMSNILLCSQKIYYGLYLSHTSLVKKLPIPYCSRSFITFNSIDITVRNATEYNSLVNKRKGIRRRASIDVGPFINIKKMYKRGSPKSLENIHVDKILDTIYENELLEFDPENVVNQEIDEEMNISVKQKKISF